MIHFVFFRICLFFFFFNDTATTEIYTTHNTLSLHDALPILGAPRFTSCSPWPARARSPRSEEHTSELQSLCVISYAVFCLKKKKKRDLRLYALLRGVIREFEHQLHLLRVLQLSMSLFFFNDTATTEIYPTHNTLSLHDALPISGIRCTPGRVRPPSSAPAPARTRA